MTLTAATSLGASGRLRLGGRPGGRRPVARLCSARRSSISSALPASLGLPLGLKLGLGRRNPRPARVWVGQLRRQLVAARRRRRARPRPRRSPPPRRGSRARSAHSSCSPAPTALAAILVESSASTPARTSPARAHSASTCPNSPPSAPLVARDESARSWRDPAPGWPRSPDRRRPPRSAARSPATSAPHRIGVQQQRHHHRRVMRRATPPILPISAHKTPPDPARRPHRSQTAPDAPPAANPADPAATTTPDHDRTQ